MNEVNFNKTIKAIKANGEKLAQSIHEAGLFALSQANQHGNIDFGKRLIEAMGKKHDVKRVEKWLCHFGKFGMVKGELVFKKRKDIAPENYDAWMTKANDVPYWELTPQEHHKETIDVLKLLAAIPKAVKAAHKKQEEGKNVEINNEALLTQVNELIAKLSANAPVAQQA